MTNFDSIYKRASKRKGGTHALKLLLPPVPDRKKLHSYPDSFFLEEMSRCIFRAGFSWKVVDNKWAGFKEAFYDFELNKLMALSPEQWDNYRQDKRIIRYQQRINAVRNNLWFVNEISARNGGFGAFLAKWEVQNIIDLFAYLKKNGSRLGGNSGQYFLQNAGVDSFVLSGDVVTCLQDCGLDIHDHPNSKKDLNLIQNTFNNFHKETGLPFIHLSMIMAYSIGDNEILLSEK